MTLSKTERIVFLYEKQGRKCPYCSSDLIVNGEIVSNFNIDHILPLSRGGKDSIENMTLACVACNSAKGNMTAEEFSIVATKFREGKITKKDFSDYAKYLVLKAKFE